MTYYWPPVSHNQNELYYGVFRMKLGSIIGVFGLVAVGMVSCTGTVVYFVGKTAYNAVEDNTEWGEAKKLRDAQNDGLTEIFTDRKYGDYDDGALVSRLEAHGWPVEQAARFPECHDTIAIGEDSSDDEQQITLVKGCMKNTL